MTKADNPKAVIGDNGAMQTKAAEDLAAYIKRIENVDDEIDGLKQDVKDIYTEAAGTGFDVKVLRKVIARRKRDRAEVQEEDALIETYENNLGAFA